MGADASEPLIARTPLALRLNVSHQAAWGIHQQRQRSGDAFHRPAGDLESRHPAPFSHTGKPPPPARGSIPGNPLLAEPLYLTKYIERMGTGDMIRRGLEAGLPEPEFSLTNGFVVNIRRKIGQVAHPVTPPVTGQVAGEVTGQVTGEVARQSDSQPESGGRTDPVTGQVTRWIVVALGHCQAGARSRREIQEAIGFRHRETFQRNYLDQLLADSLLERTLPDKPNSRLQKYRLTEKGRAWLAARKMETCG